MQWIGLTGGLASGKSTVANILRALSYIVVDADQIVWQLTQPQQDALAEIIQAFGPEVIDQQGLLNRKYLAQIIFKNPLAKQQLENILHPRVQKEVLRQKESGLEQGLDIMFYDVPLLFEKKMQNQFDATVLVFTERDLQVQRMRQRNQWTEEHILDRLSAQLPLIEKKHLASYIIENNTTLENLKHEVLKCVTWLKNRQS